MAQTDKRPIIVVKRKRGAAAHHGGAWKVAYADFVTAMMAFFMVMWLVASVSKEQRAALFEYFKNPSMEQGKSAKPAPGQSGPGGASTAVINLHGGLDAPKSADAKQNQGLGKTSSTEEARRVAEEDERKQLESLEQQLREAIDRSQALAPYKDQLLLDITPEGLRIQIVDKLNRTMFESGSSSLKNYTTEILVELAKYINAVPNRISLSGHTDDKPFAGRNGYTNWELSSERANAARRALVSGGLEEGKIARVVGLAAAVPFMKADPLNPINRRISVIVMTKHAEEAALATDSPQISPGGSAESDVPSAPAGAEPSPTEHPTKPP
jgi:chemotaxis protein MotB